MQSLRTRRPGMQVHAVPESERAFDPQGRRLPWGYEYPSANTESERNEPVEKGPFGRSMRRSRTGTSRSRSKTAEPRREEDRVRAENIAAEDAVFGSLRRVGTKEDAEAIANAGEGAQGVARITQMDADSEPTEVLLYGFGQEMQWAAIDFYERVSNGFILEDYERQAPGARFDISRSLGRATAQRSLSRAAMRKKNKYAGGEHWIKVTFDSRRAAELAIARQPHIIKGYLVYAEPFQGRGPQKDEPVFATQAGAQITSDALPLTFSTNALGDSPSGSNTVSSATATGTTVTNQRSSRPGTGPHVSDSPTPSSSTIADRAVQQLPEPSAPPAWALAGTSSAVQPHPATGSRPTARRARIEGVTRAVVLPAELALAPKAPKQSWGTWLGAGDIIGAAVPRREDGTFDWERASLYWRLFYWIDGLLGTDYCGLKGED